MSEALQAGSSAAQQKSFVAGYEKGQSDTAKRQFQVFCSEHFHGLADILERLDTDQLWAWRAMKLSKPTSATWNH